MPMPHRTQQQVIKRRLIGKEGAERVRELRSILAELPGYRNGPYADLRKWVEGELDATRTRKRVVHRDSIAVRREGAAQIALVGPPNAGKSSLLQALSAIQIRTGDYAFTTTRPVAATTRLGGVLVQLVEIPGLIEGAADDRGGGRSLLGVLRNADAILWCHACDRPLEELETIRREVAAAGIDLPGAVGSDEMRRSARAEPSRAVRPAGVCARRHEPRPAARGALGTYGPDARLPSRRGRPDRAAAAGDGPRRSRLDPSRARGALHRRTCLGPVSAVRGAASRPAPRAAGRRHSGGSRPLASFRGLATPAGRKIERR